MIIIVLNCRSVGDVIKNLQCEVSKDSTFEMVVRRGKVLSDALRRMERLTFEPNKQLKVFTTLLII